MEAPITNQKSSDPVATNVKGSVKWFHRARGFGFITREDTNEDIFVHYKSIKPMSINLRKDKRRLNLMDKEKVVFDIVKTKDSFEAVNVVGKDGYYIIDIIAFKREIPPFDLEIINDARVTGKVKWFNVKIKYGFIHCDYNNEDVFVHSSAIVKNNPDKFKPSLGEGEPVEFDILKRPDGKLEAVNVSGPQGTSVEGSRYSPDKRDTSSKNYIEKDLVGKVKWFNVKAGFGFINRNDNGQDVYAHYSAIIKKNPNHSVRSLADGELVQFNLIEGSKGMEAADITGMNDEPVQGSEYARPINTSSNRSEPRNSSRTRTSSNSRVPRQRMPRTNPANANNNPYPNTRQPRQMRLNGPKPMPNTRRMNNYPKGAAAPYPPSTRSQMPEGRAPMNAAGYDSNPRYQNQPIASNPIQNFSSMRGPHQQFPYGSNNNRYINGMEGTAFIPAMPMPPPLLSRNDPTYNPPISNGYFNQRMPANNYQYQNPTSGNGVLVDQRVQGFVKWYNFKNGFGFVTRSDNNQDIFVHRSGIQASDASQPSLDDGEQVEFDVYQDGTRLLALNVTGPNGTMLRGSKYATSNRMRMNDSSAMPPSKVYHKRKAN